MRKLLLSAAAVLAVTAAQAQYDVFMGMMAHKMLCHEDRLVNFLEHNYFVRIDHTLFEYQYAYKGAMQQVTVLYDNPCYAIYKTTNVDEYNAIKKRLSGICDPQAEADGTPGFHCNNKQIFHAQVYFMGYYKTSGTYEIKIYQHEQWDDSYNAPLYQ